MTFPDFPQYQDPILRRAFDQIDADSEASRTAREAEEAAFLAEVEAIGTDAAEVAPEPEAAPAPRQLKGTGDHVQGPDPDDPDVIIHEPKVTRFDKAMTTLRELEAQKAALPVDADVHSVVSLDCQIAEARKKKQRAESDVSRKQEGVDDWRKGPGREEYNEKRRNGNGTPHAYSREELSRMDPADKTQHEKDMAWKRCERSRLKKKGLSGEHLEAELAVKFEKYLSNRAAKANDKAAEEGMRIRPFFGMF